VDQNEIVTSAAIVAAASKKIGVSPQVLDAAFVPTSLRHLLPLAEVWGVADDGYRERVTRAAGYDAWEFLRRALLDLDDELDRWHTGPESRKRPFSKEFIAFGAMRMAADLGHPKWFGNTV
jgi:hypothetical protein